MSRIKHGMCGLLWIACLVGVLELARSAPAKAQSADSPKTESDSSSTSEKKSDEETSKDSTEPTDTKVRKTNAEWQRILTRPQFLVTRLKETEAPFTGRYAQGHFNGTFVCVCCQGELFSSRTKFESGTGWPSFWQPIRKNAISTEWDYSAGTPRVEVMCSRCDAHLGHVFDDGPAPTGLRFCINSVAIKLKPAAKSTTKPVKKSSKSKSAGKS